MNKVRSLIIVLISSSFFCTGKITSINKRLLKSITTDSLLGINYAQLQEIDTVTAYLLCKKHSVLHDWELQAQIIKEFKSEEYLQSNLESELEKSRREFIRNNHLYHFDLGKDLKDRALITKLKKNEQDLEKVRLIVTRINDIDTTLVVSEYVHGILISELTIKSITNFYSDDSIEFIKTSNSCSDVIMKNGTFSCDSVRETVKYIIDKKGRKINSSKTTERFPYSYGPKIKR